MPKTYKSSPNEMLPLKVVIGMSLQLGISVATTTILTVYGGHWLDEKYDTKFFFWIGLILGLTLSFYLVWKIVKNTLVNE
jgi:hypothetical protein